MFNGFRFYYNACYRVNISAVLFLSFNVVFHFAPIENENKPLDQKQKKRNKKIAIALTLVVSLLSCAVYVFSVQTSALLAFTQLAIAVLIVITRIGKGGKKDGEDEKIDT